METLESLLEGVAFEIENETGIPIEVIFEGNLITIKQG
jgi:hypothetical protein